jgi:protein-disulfide isomerase
MLAALAAAAACGRAEAPGRDRPGTAAAATPDSRGAASGDSSALRTADVARIQGDTTAPVWMIIVSDFQCPYCKTWHDQTYPALQKEYVQTGKVRMAYVNYPLPSHRNALPAAEAAMCAGVQGKFWPMQDALFGAQEQWSRMSAPAPFFDSLATRAGVDAAAMRACVEGRAVRRLIEADKDRADRAGINSTPSFIIGDSLIEGAYPVQRFRTALDAVLAAQQGR